MHHPGVDIKHILYATDFSENARYAFSYAASLADRYGAKITLLHVSRDAIPDLLVFDVGIDRSAGVKERFSVTKEHLKEAEAALLDMVRTEFGRETIGSDDIVVEKGDPVKVILRVAKERNCDLMVMGITGRRSLEDAMLGDTARRVLHRTTLPVLVVQHPDQG